MACSYNFDIPVDPIALMKMVRQVVEQNGGIVMGEIPDVSVTFRTAVGEVGGDCRLVGGSVVNINVKKKPEFVSCAMVRDRLVFYITEAVKMYSQQMKAAKQMEAQVAI